MISPYMVISLQGNPPFLQAPPPTGAVSSYSAVHPFHLSNKNLMTNE